jgi:hypothetical protein
MLKVLSLFIAGICFCGLLVCAFTHKEGESWKPIFGGAWGTFVFVSAYFGLKSTERWERSDEFKRAKREFQDVVEVGMPTDEAERVLQSRARLVDVADRRYYGGHYKNREFRVAEFAGRLSSIKVLSLEGKVFEIQSEPKR